MKHYTFSLLAIVFSMGSSFASHGILGGTIYAQQTGAKTFDISILLFTRFYSVDSIGVNLGDGSSRFAVRINGNDNNGNSIPDGEFFQDSTFLKSIYRLEHTYADTVVHIVSFTGVTRVDGIANIDLGSSMNLPFYIEDSIWNRDALLASYNYANDCPLFAYIDSSYNCEKGYYSTSADSLTFEQITPLQSAGSIVPGYQLPHQTVLNANNNWVFDTRTAEIIWNAPQQAGIYCYAYRTIQFHHGEKVSSAVFDMLIYVINGTTTGIEQPEPENLLQVFPNPNRGAFEIKTNGAAVEIVNSLGEVVFKSVTNSYDKTIIAQLNVSGVYFISILSSQGSRITKKVVVY